MKFFHDLSFRQKVSLMVSLHVLLLLIFVFFRYIAADEGLYLSAAREVAAGNRPYLDFAYVHPPYFPYLLAPFSDWEWKSLFLSRLFSALPSLFLGVALFWIARRLWNEKIGFYLWGLWVLNGLLLAWNTVVKPAAWADFFGLLAFWSLMEAGRRRGCFFSGLWSGMAAGLRAFMLAPAAVYFLFLALRSERLRMEKLLFWCFGFILTLSFSLYFFLRAPAGFVFDNVTYHYLWGVRVIAEAGGFGFLDRVASVAKFVFFPQNSVLFLFALGAVATFLETEERYRRNLILLIAALFGALAATFFFTTPSPLAYYVQTAPYLVLLAGFGARRLLGDENERFSPVLRRGVGAAHLISLGLIAYIFLFGQRPRDRQYLLSNMKPMIEHLRENGSPTDTLLSEWPGYAVLAGMRQPHGTETVGLDVAHLLTPQENMAYHLLDSAGADSLLRFKKVRWVVTGGRVADVWSEPLAANYIKDYDVGPIRIYRRKE